MGIAHAWLAWQTLAQKLQLFCTGSRQQSVFINRQHAPPNLILSYLSPCHQLVPLCYNGRARNHGYKRKHSDPSHSWTNTMKLEPSLEELEGFYKALSKARNRKPASLLLSALPTHQKTFHSFYKVSTIQCALPQIINNYLTKCNTFVRSP